MSGPKSNSFHYVPVRDVPRAPGTPCPLRASRTRSEQPARTLHLRLRDRMRTHVTRTNDFDDVELAKVRDELGQIYVDVSTKVAPDDFARDFRKLALDGECAACELRGACGGAFVMTTGNVFARDDEHVHAALRGLRGDVVDLGCGEGPYLATLERAALDGNIRYTGVDPDGARLEMLALRHPWGRFVASRAEDLAHGGADHVLALRSVNHLENPAAAFAAAIAALRPGGTLTLVDNVAFGLVRSVETARRAERGAGEFEHFRNDGAAELVALLADAPLELLERHDVGPATSNQWMLRYTRLPDRVAPR